MTTPAPTNDYFLLGIQSSRDGLEQYDLWHDLSRQADAPRSYLLRLAADRLQRQLPAAGVHEGWLQLWATLNSILHFLVLDYCRERAARFAGVRLTAADAEIEVEPLAAVLRELIRLYPPTAVMRGKLEPEAFLRKQLADDATPLVAELFLLGLQQENRALARVRPLYRDDELNRRTGYRQTLDTIDQLLADLPGPRPAESLWQRLRAPLEVSPDSLEGQLHYLRTAWGHRLPQTLLWQLASAFDLLAEITAARTLGRGPAAGFGLAAPGDLARFSADTDWMARTVLLAKSIHVWLDQLSRDTGRELRRIDQIPDGELDRIAGRGFNSLWLIGCWQRSDASRKIKQLCGAYDAAASAYALYDYVIADDLGGEAALQDLQDRCRARGIRLACDVVPNHTGIDSRWLREAPDDFLQADRPPYPSYRFNGPDLSDDPVFSLRIEDGYFDRSEAAVVFQYRDHGSGRERYIYHGNDGTHTPWNDTAQLDYLKAHVREKMIRLILQVARHFSVIRFDAAMTLARKHFQRLWYPLPGGGAGVPSRAAHWLPPEEFDRLFPLEFWREVVDRMRAEAPDTLLIAEAFWMMEGYFVRTLGMHRVYNSAFMHMLKQEHNGRYRQQLKDVLQQSPGILQRFVNFLSNPDEETAIGQFGDGDKYFGAATLLATMPGLPMFAHGQIEGLHEKYGMEFRSARWHETANAGLIERHERQIFPLLRRRRLFSGAEHFQLFDFAGELGGDENVYAFVNRHEGEAALVVFNNRYGDTSGWLHWSVERVAGAGDASEQSPRTSASLGAALGLAADDRIYRYRDLTGSLEYLRTGRQLHEEGMYLSLPAYGHHVFWEFREVSDPDGRWRALWHRLGGHGCPDLEEELGLRRPPLPPLPRREREAVTAVRPLRVLFVASEVAPFAKSGGLADVAGALPPALARLGQDVRLVLPAYPRVGMCGLPITDSGERIDVTLGGVTRTAEVLESSLDGVPVWLLRQEELFSRDGLYGTADGDYPDNPVRFTFFCRAVLELVKQLNWCPDIIHVHDWQTALVPALLRTDYADDAFFARTATLLTVHNLGYHGAFSMKLLESLALHPALASVDGLEFYGGLNPLKGGLMFADRINTVSPTYCREIRTAEMGHGLDGVLRACGDRLTGILNGLDPAVWDPAADQVAKKTFDSRHLGGKAACKKWLQQAFNLPVDPEIPIFAFVSRLDRQKGVDLLMELWDWFGEQPLQLVLLGTGNRRYMDYFSERRARDAGWAALVLAFDEQVSRRIYAGSDLFLMPSLYEPCGLSQLIALRYGTVPVVRRTGGLADTVIDIAEQPETGTGIVFNDFTAAGLKWAVERGLTLFHDQPLWKAVQRRGMRQDFSWDSAARDYLALYQQALADPR